MVTYIVFTRESTRDQRELDAYQASVAKTFAGHPIKILAAYGPQQLLEGEAPEGVVTRADGVSGNSTITYQAIVKHRFRGATYRAMIVEGLAHG
jgi:uncharacterized protein (DUF1330 family)